MAVVAVFLGLAPRGSLLGYWIQLLVMHEEKSHAVMLVLQVQVVP